MKITRVYGDAEGVTHFEEIPIVVPSGKKWTNSPALASAHIVFRSYAPPDPDRVYDPHPTHTRQFMVMVSGRKEIETSDGERQTFQAPDVLLMDDGGSAGHITRTLSDDRWQLSIELPESFDLARWIEEVRGL